MSYRPGDMVKLSPESAAYVTRDADNLLSGLKGIVIKSSKREVVNERGSLGIVTEVMVTDIVDVMWNDGSVQSVDGRWLIKITARDCSIEEMKDG